MADIQSVIVKIDEALTEAHLVAGSQSPAQQIAALQAQLAAETAAKDAAVAALAPYKTFRDAAVADAQARKAADAAKVEGDDILTAAAGLP